MLTGTMRGIHEHTLKYRHMRQKTNWFLQDYKLDGVYAFTTKCTVLWLGMTGFSRFLHLTCHSMISLTIHPHIYLYMPTEYNYLYSPSFEIQGPIFVPSESLTQSENMQLCTWVEFSLFCCFCRWPHPMQAKPSFPSNLGGGLHGGNKTKSLESM